MLIPLLLAAALPAPSQPQMKATVVTLVGFGTRHTLSTTTDPKRGIGAARDWAASRFRAIAADCGGCIKVERISRSFTGPRAPNGVVVEDVLGIQPGRDPNRVVIVGGHIDSRVTNEMNATSDAPGANDDASGVALVLEAARILSKRHYDATIVYAIFSGEEQGLWGSTLLADTAKARGWQVSAMLNNDIIGNSIGQGGVREAKTVRVFSEGIRAVEDLPQQMARRADGGEDDGPSRALAKAIDGIAGTIPGGLDVFVDRRPDRFGRGGDHEPFLKLGYPAVRFSVAAENWDRQHQDLRTENGVVLWRHDRGHGFRVSGQGDRDQHGDDRSAGQRAGGAAGRVDVGRVVPRHDRRLGRGAWRGRLPGPLAARRSTGLDRQTRRHGLEDRPAAGAGRRSFRRRVGARGGRIGKPGQLRRAATALTRT